MARKFIPWAGIGKEEDYAGLESHLEGVLRPVSPNADFIRNLGHQLRDQWSALPVSPSLGNNQTLLLFVAGIFGGIVVMVISVRIAIMLLTALGVLQHYRKQMREESSLQ